MIMKMATLRFGVIFLPEDTTGGKKEVRWRTLWRTVKESVTATLRDILRCLIV
jgi:hypothetical protein